MDNQLGDAYRITVKMDSRTNTIKPVWDNSTNYARKEQVLTFKRGMSRQEVSQKVYSIYNLLSPEVIQGVNLPELVNSISMMYVNLEKR